MDDLTGIASPDVANCSGRCHSWAQLVVGRDCLILRQFSWSMKNAMFSCIRLVFPAKHDRYTRGMYNGIPCITIAVYILR